MTLSSMVVSRDWMEVSVLECILGGLHMDVNVEDEPQKALARLSKSKIDALIVDCDLNGSWRVFQELRNSQKQHNTVPLVIMGGPHCANSLDQTGALFAFEKPISVENAVRTLSAARNMIVDGRLRYHRTGLEVPVSLKCKGRDAKGAHLVNVSQGGMQVHTDHFIDADTVMQVSFELPGARAALKANAEVVWHDKSGNFGMKFTKVARPEQRTLQLWLAQQFLAN